MQLCAYECAFEFAVATTSPVLADFRYYDDKHLNVAPFDITSLSLLGWMQTFNSLKWYILKSVKVKEKFRDDDD